MIDVINRGMGGEEAPDERDRLQRDVINENPSWAILAGRHERGLEGQRSKQSSRSDR